MQGQFVLNKATNEWEFIANHNQSLLAAGWAGNCPNFSLDDDDECVAEETVSCLNCRYRKWTQDSFSCLKMGVDYFEPER